MTFSPLDWVVLVGFLAFVLFVAWRTSRLTKNVSDFLSSGRCAGRYLLTVSSGMVSFSAVGMLGRFQVHYESGFTAIWWFLMGIPAGLFLSLSGWVVYRYRATRVFTLGQFFEKRYSRNFRIGAATLCWVSGILNAGVIPGITANFLIHYAGLDPSLSLLGFSIRFWLILGMVVAAAAIAMYGGIISVMITDFIQGIALNILFLSILAVILVVVGWGNIIETIGQRPPGQSMINPFDIGGQQNFNIFYFLMGIFFIVYSMGAWQGNAGYQVSAKSPQEQKMAGILGQWRIIMVFLMLAIIPVAAYTLMHHPSFAAQALEAGVRLDGVEDPSVLKQVRVPVILTQLIPQGLLGLFLAVMLGAALSTDDSMFHSYGSILLQDVAMPLRGHALSPAAHMSGLRVCIAVTAGITVLISSLLPVREYIEMWFNVTAAIFFGGAGTCLVGGLYWKRGTTPGAWAGLLVGSSLGLFGALSKVIWPDFPVNAQIMAFIACIAAIAVYVTVSLLTCRKPHNMDKLLHRGAYAVAEDRPKEAGHANRFFRVLGITDHFSRHDILIYLLQIAWSGFWIVVFAGGTFWALTRGIADAQWKTWWGVYLWIAAIFSLTITVWFLIGGISDVRYLFRTLRERRGLDHEDGFVRDRPDDA